ncbi:PREDICTED: uncharacterized protein LOC106556402 [Thamnophis sirtalis]|uniref:ribonuclease H n=1 Tax=Thamnophis sirtalis TaxID=35019 RepID=A0A6I9Z4H8_9SAUR|nr:PREDICTED: uncharacterized protein LOC106556402 [Thamnophis sirtalis]
MVRRSLRWWLSPALAKGSPFKEPTRLTIKTDASLYGWGAHFRNQLAQGRWSTAEASHSINWLELRVVQLALICFQAGIWGCHVKVLTDNVSTKAHINRQGGTRSRSLMSEADDIGRWAEELSIQAEHISGTTNIQADWLSRATVDHSEWRLHPQLFQRIVQRFGCPQVDLFAMAANSHPREKHWHKLDVCRTHCRYIKRTASFRRSESLFISFQLSSQGRKVQNAVPPVNPGLHQAGTSIDLKEAYLHVPICKAHRRYLRFTYAGQHYQYRAMLFGLSSAPRMFTKVLVAVAAFLRSRPVRLHYYLDDVLIQSSSPQQAVEDLQYTMQVLQGHGFSINLEKSHLHPTTRLQHLGAVIDTVTCQVFLSPERMESLREMAMQVRRSPRAKVVLLSQLLDKMISCLSIIPWSRIHSRPLQWLLLPYQRANESSSSRLIPVSAKMCRSLSWWLSPALKKGSPFKELTRLTVTTDASLYSWGAHFRNQIAQGRWSSAEAGHSINWLELRAVWLALLRFQMGIRGHHVPAVGSQRPRLVGGAPSAVHSGGAHLRHGEHPGALAEQGDCRSLRVVPVPAAVPAHSSEVQLPPGGSVHYSGQLSSYQVLLQVSRSKGRGGKRSSLPLAERSALRLSPFASSSQSHQGDPGGGSGDPSGGPLLAQEDLVCRSGESVRLRPVVDSSTRDFSLPGGPSSSRAPVAATSHLALERDPLSKDNLSTKVIRTIQASRRPSTTRIYNATWRSFVTWCSSRGASASSASIPVILDFLQDSVDKGLAPNTLHRQVTALSTILAPEGQPSLGRHPTIRSFLRGATNLSPLMVHRYPTWDLNVVLRALVEPPFEPLLSASFKQLTFKTVFLIAITSARCISELAALSVRADLCLFHQDRVVLRLDPSFVPKINSWFHRAQEVILPDFGPHLRHPREERWHKLDVRRVLRSYIKRTASFCRYLFPFSRRLRAGRFPHLRLADGLGPASLSLMFFSLDRYPIASRRIRPGVLPPLRPGRRGLLLRRFLDLFQLCFQLIQCWTSQHATVPRLH